MAILHNSVFVSSLQTMSRTRQLISVTYGELIDLYESVSGNAAEQGQQSADDLFIERFHEKFPTYHLSHPKRFIETVQQIVAPTKLSLRGPPKLSGFSLLTYHSKTWKPRIPNPKGSSSGTVQISLMVDVEMAIMHAVCLQLIL